MQRVSIPLWSKYLRQLEGQKFTYTRQGKLEAALAVEKEMKDVAEQLKAANALFSTPGASMQMTIQSVVFGDHATNRTRDITKSVLDALEAGAPTVRLYSEKSDPAPYVPKKAIVKYTINGQRKQKIFREDHKLNFKEDLD